MDDKLVVVSRNEIRLWDFYDHKEEAPELITAMNLGEEDGDFEFENVYTNKNSRCKELFVLATCQNMYRLYSGRLKQEFKEKANRLEDARERFTSAAFSKDSSYWIMGSTKGRICSYRTIDGEEHKSPC